MSFKSITTAELAQYKNDVFEGYLWYSDQTKPEVFTGSTQDLSDKLTDLPFVVEGFIYYPAEKRSLHIQNIDGAYFIGQVDLMDQEHDVTWPAHRMGDNISELKIKLGSDRQEDPLNPPFTIDVPTWKAFIGFERK